MAGRGKAPVEGVSIAYLVQGEGLPLATTHPYTMPKAGFGAYEGIATITVWPRGFGDSGTPPSTPDHGPYGMREIARDQLQIMSALGYDRFSVVGHDRGGRCAYRMALDHPERVQKLAVLDIVPTAEMWRHVDMELGLVDWHWFFLAQPHPFPERLIAAAPDEFYFRGDRSRFHHEALADYLRCVRAPETIHAMCEDYRAGATIDHELDEEDRRTGRRIACPVLALWAGRDELGRWFDVLEVWRRWADDVRGRAIDCGHFLAEEAPHEVYAELRSFFR